jgi:hypothetical protein
MGKVGWSVAGRIIDGKKEVLILLMTAMMRQCSPVIVKIKAG